MAIDISSIQTFTDAQLLILYRWALANNAAGQTRTIEGRTVAFPPLDQLMKAVDWLEGRENAVSGGGIAEAQFNDQSTSD